MTGWTGWRRIAHVAFLVLIAIIPGCTATPVVTPTPRLTAAPEPSRSAAAVAPAVWCAEFQFDAGATLGPEFRADLFVNDESQRIAARFIAAIEGWEAGRAGFDPCGSFTADGLRALIAFDPRLAAVARGQVRVDARLVLRAAFEGRYDLRARPPRLPLDIVYDLRAGSSISDVTSGDVSTSDAPERRALQVT
ncbi:MAG TPA: hypothetical protein VGO64_04950, partial [Candidatus Limnocylindrales bacterium]|nr:hypothetical protein [Candidatus Limnocylindrales bacterium]